MLDKESFVTVADGEYPFYEAPEKMPSNEKAKEKSTLRRGPGSGSDADTIQGILAVTAAVAGPNKLVATGKDGKLPAGIIPP